MSILKVEVVSLNMKKSKLIELLSTFSVSEWKGFEAFAGSPFFNKRTILVRFVEILGRHFPEFEAKDIEKEVLFGKLFPGKPYDDKTMRYEMNYLSRLAEQFLVHRDLMEDESLIKLRLAAVYSKRQLEKHYKKEMNGLEKWSSNKEIDPEFYLKKVRQADLANRHFLQKKVRQFDAHIQIASEELDYFYLAKKLQYWCGMLDRQKILNVQYDLRFESVFEQYFEQEDFVDHPFLRIYYGLFKVLKEETEPASFDALFAQLLEAKDVFTQEDLQTIFRLMINYCARQIRGGEEAFVQKALDIYLKGIEYKVVMDEGFMSPWTYKNIVSLGLRLKRYEWTQHFIEKNQLYLHPRFRLNVLNFNLADLHFHQKAYDKTLYYLNFMKFNDIYFNLNGRVLLLKTYFHLEETEPLFSLVKSFSQYLKRDKKIAENTKKSYMNFCKILMKVEKNRFTPQKGLLDEIQNMRLLISKNWLKDCVNEEN